MCTDHRLCLVGLVDEDLQSADRGVSELNEWLSFIVILLMDGVSNIFMLLID